MVQGLFCKRKMHMDNQRLNSVRSKFRATRAPHNGSIACFRIRPSCVTLDQHIITHYENIACARLNKLWLISAMCWFNNMCVCVCLCVKQCALIQTIVLL